MDCTLALNAGYQDCGNAVGFAKTLLDLFNQDSQLATDLQNAQGYTRSELLRMADAHTARLFPACPKNQGYASKTFWRVLFDARPIHAALCGSVTARQRIADFLLEDKVRASKGNARRESEGRPEREVWPPKPVFCKPVFQPEPWTGKYEKENAHIPNRWKR